MPELFTSIESVNIFRNGAEVTRKGKTELKEGIQTVRVHGLSLTARQDSARLFSLPGIQCSNLRFEKADPDDPDLTSNRIQKEIDLLGRQIEVKELQVSLWQTNGDFSGRDNAGVEDVEKYIEKLPERLVGLHQELTDLKEKLKELEKKHNDAKTEDSLPLMMADIYVDKAGEYPFELHYHEQVAAWLSVYEIHSNKKEDLEIKHRARIFQSTHEDWKNVNVTLYSGDPSKSGSLPELHPVELDLRENISSGRMMMKTAMPTGMMGSMANPMAANDTLEDTEATVELDHSERLEMLEAEVNSEETMTEYVLSGKRDILKENKDTMADLQTSRISTVYKTVTVPKADPSAYLIASIKSADLPYPDMDSADIYLNGVYTNRLEMDNDLSKEDVEITLGKEERVHVSHRNVSKKTSNVLLKGQKAVTHIYETLINNLTDEEMTVILRDQVPVSGNKEVTVETVETAGEPDKETGIFEKEIKIAPKQSEKVRLEYKVSYPKGKYLKETLKTNGRTCPSCGAKISAGLRFCPECGTPVQ